MTVTGCVPLAPVAVSMPNWTSQTLISAASGKDRKYELSECNPPALHETELAAVIDCEVDWVRTMDPHDVPAGTKVCRSGFGISNVEEENDWATTAVAHMLSAIAAGATKYRIDLGMVKSPGVETRFSRRTGPLSQQEPTVL
ncbi:MAG: hypothetical protein KDI80_06175 [Xanthomonadales bacterium]|nr:hypothetical protein [Xanthomonadales bacterium]